MGKVAKVEAQEALLPADPMISMIERVAMDPSTDIAKLERMLDLKAKHDAQQSKVAFDRDFAKASAEFPTVPQNGRNTHNGQSYSTLKDILTSVRPVLTKFGFALSFSTEGTADTVTVVAELSHEEGHSKRNSISLPKDTGPGRNPVQSIGSTQTYGQRYTAQAILGLSLGEDTEDDGGSTGKVQEQAPKKPYSWANTITQDMPENSTPREKAEAIAKAICAQWKRMNGTRQIDNEWDRRAALIAELESKHRDLWETVIEGYEQRRHHLEEQRAEKERV